MVYLALIALVGGIACGMAGLDDTLPVEMIVSHKDLILYALMFLVGISIGLNRGIIKKIKEYHIRIFVIPAGIIAGSLAGGIVSGLLTGPPLNDSTAIASGLGRYRLSGVAIGNLAGAQAGGPDMGGQQPGGNAGGDGQQYYDADYEVVDDDKK